MGKNVDYKQFEQFAKKLEKQLSDEKREKFMEDCCKEIAARLLRRVIKRTPTVEGALKRGWSVDGNKNINVVKRGGEYRCAIYNPVQYSSFVEFGHRRVPGVYIPSLGKSTTAGWTDGKFMLTISEKEVQSLAPALLEKRLMELLKGAFE